jgi:hypothetical protein
MEVQLGKFPDEVCCGAIPWSQQYRFLGRVASAVRDLSSRPCSHNTHKKHLDPERMDYPLPAMGLLVFVA